jgi:TonB family protein
MRILLTIPLFAALGGLAKAQTDASETASLQRQIEASPRASLLHYRLGELFLRQQNYQSSANEFREALNGDLEPDWVEAWSHRKLGDIFSITGQQARASLEYQHAQRKPSRSVPAAIVRLTGDPTEEARIAGLEGEVILRAQVNPDGTVSDARVVEPLGMGLDQKAIEAVRAWRFPSPNRAQESDIAVDFLQPDHDSRWHLLRADFPATSGVTRPHFLSAPYPPGAGISARAIDDGKMVGAIGRQGTASISFEIDEPGNPARLFVEAASMEVWGSEAAALVRAWRFSPAMKDGSPVTSSCVVDLVWGQRNLTAEAIQWARTSLRNTGQ